MSTLISAPKLKTINKTIQNKIETVLHQALKKHTRLFIFRLDYHFPVDIDCKTDSKVITRHFDSLKAKLNAHEKRKITEGKRVHPNGLEYFWVREVGPKSGKTHYHVMLTFNKDAFYTLGKFNSQEHNLFKMIQTAWQSALGLNENIEGLVHSCDFDISYLDKNRADFNEKYDGWINHLSYLAKDFSKPYGDGNRVFGCSR
ncbi:inovirus Gp2 family protein [Providencia rettgeri]|uniref:inovirus Gp2 family protein n=1 Tax=Providencia rettgeri TaxID=587 RepID=UPI0023AA85C4|nr:inovirus Gp2 family protein [Providencia rettgeri]